jgi:hypothetical protein
MMLRDTSLDQIWLAATVPQTIRAGMGIFVRLSNSVPDNG